MKIGLLGIGTVGSGVVKVLQENKELFQQQTGKHLVITHIFTRSVDKAKAMNLTDVIITNQIEELYQAKLDLVIEVMGGVEHTKDIVMRFLKQGVPVVTANKDMLAIYADELADIANENQVSLMYEASVAGGIPIINGVSVGLASNQITGMMGILNGTTNYMLTRMAQDGWTYEEALTKAQAEGYAEADPTNDVGGFDAGRKIALLSRLAYRTQINMKDVKIEGIQGVTAQDIALAKEIGYTMKLIGRSQLTGRGFMCQVAPMLIANSHPLAHVTEATNAVYVEGNAVGQTMFWGPGAGSLATASAVVSDVLQIAQRGFVPNWRPNQALTIEDPQSTGQYYLRFAQPSNHVRSVLQTLEIGYLTLADQDVFVIKTETISTEQLLKISQHTALEAKYQMI